LCLSLSTLGFHPPGISTRGEHQEESPCAGGGEDGGRRAGRAHSRL
jgi:hypothetical protein